MPLPAGLETVTVSGQVTRPGTGTSPEPLVGRIVFTPDVPQIVKVSTGAIIMGTVTAEPDAAGNFQAVLLAPDATGINPTGWSYRVDIDFNGLADPEAFHISLTKTVPAVQLASRIPIGPTAGGLVGGGTVQGDLTVTGNLSVGGQALVTPIAHASSHAIGGSDVLTPAAIGADPAGAATAARAYADSIVPLDWINATKAPYGATGDNATDDTAAIQAALNVCPAGGIVYLPRGRYRTSAPLVLPPGVTLQMPHANLMVAAGLTDPQCYIKPLSTFSGAAVILLKDQATGVYASTPAEHRLLNIQIDGSAYTATAVDGIQANGNIQNVVMRGVTIRYMSGNGIYTDINTGIFPYSWRLYSVMIDNCAGHGYAFNVMTDITMIDCQAIGNHANGFQLVNLANSHLVACRAEWNGNYGFNFTGNWGSGNGAGALTAAACSTDRNGWDGIHIDATGTTPFVFTGLMLRRDGRNGGTGGGGYAAFATYGTTTPVTVSGLTVYPGVDDGGAGTNSPQYGVNVQNVTTVFTVNDAYIQAATTAVRDDGTNGTVLIGPDVVTATGTTAAPVIAPTAPWNWLGTARARHTAATSNILEGRVVGEAFSRAVMQANGTVVFGSGTANPDTPGFYRESAGNLKTDSFLVANGSGQSNGTWTVWGADKKALRAGSAGGGLSVAEGANARLGVATLAGGTVTVANTSVTATSRVFLTRATAGGTLGQLSYTLVAGTSLTINSSSGSETSTVNWMIVEPS
jgi:hypothetical protein